MRSGWRPSTKSRTRKRRQFVSKLASEQVCLDESREFRERLQFVVSLTHIHPWLVIFLCQLLTKGCLYKDPIICSKPVFGPCMLSVICLEYLSLCVFNKYL